MARRVFYSFHYDADNWRAGMVRNIGVVEGNRPATDNEWEKRQERWRQGHPEVDQRSDVGRSCAIVLIGRTTAGRKWINYEIQQAWADGKGLLGIHVHNLEDKNGKQTTKGRNPFEDLKVNGVNLSRIVSAYDPPRSTSTGVYGYISDHLADWVESAILTRNRY